MCAGSSPSIATLNGFSLVHRITLTYSMQCSGKRGVLAIVQSGKVTQEKKRFSLDKVVSIFFSMIFFVPFLLFPTFFALFTIFILHFQPLYNFLFPISILFFVVFSYIFNPYYLPTFFEFFRIFLPFYYFFIFSPLYSRFILYSEILSFTFSSRFF